MKLLHTKEARMLVRVGLIILIPVVFVVVIALREEEAPKPPVTIYANDIIYAYRPTLQLPPDVSDVLKQRAKEIQAKYGVSWDTAMIIVMREEKK